MGHLFILIVFFKKNKKNIFWMIKIYILNKWHMKVCGFCIKKIADNNDVKMITIHNLSLIEDITK